MIRRIQRVGSRGALILDEVILELIGRREGGEVLLTVRDGSIVITPTDPQKIDAGRFEELMDRVLKNRRDVLRRLAE